VRKIRKSQKNRYDLSSKDSFALAHIFDIIFKNDSVKEQTSKLEMLGTALILGIKCLILICISGFPSVPTIVPG